jgi:prolyl oligopeptidase
MTELTARARTAAGFAAAGDRVFCLRQDPGAAVPVLAVRGSGHGAGRERVLLDPAAIAGDEHSSLDWYVPSADGRYVACGISRGGSENATLRILDVAVGDLGAEAISRTSQGAVSWLPDGTGFTYHRHREPAPDTPARQRRHDSGAFLHLLGRPVSADVLVLARGVSELVPMSPADQPSVLVPAGSSWMIAVITHSALTGDHTLYAAPRSALDDPGSCPWRAVAGPADAVTAFAVHGDTLYAVSDRDGGRSAVLALPLPGPGPDPAPVVTGTVVTGTAVTGTAVTATVVVAAGERAIRDVRVAGEHLLVLDMDGGISRLRRVALTGGEPQEVPLPVAGTIREWTGHPDGVSALFTLQSWTSSLSVLHRRGLPLDGSSPALLTGYGSHGLVLPREFSPQNLAWYERGGVCAVAGLRGGGEYGTPWHEAGRGPNKERTITDFIDCAEHLIAAGYTSPARLAGQGGSAGGIPAAGALVRRPDLWAAMVLQLPVTNATRRESGENGTAFVPEYGTVGTAQGLRDLLAIDAYLQVEDGVPYPAVLLTAGLNDPRVPPSQPAKLAARLQAATSSGRPVLLRVDVHAGHGYGSTRSQRDHLTADIFAFLRHELARDGRGSAR